MLRKAGAHATWSPPPGPEQIRERDHARLVKDLEELSQAPAEEDLAVARALLTTRSAEQLAAALVAIRRAGLPAPEELPLSAQVQAGAKGKSALRTGYVPTHPTARTERVTGVWKSAPAASPHKPAHAERHPAPPGAHTSSDPAPAAHPKSAHAPVAHPKAPHSKHAPAPAHSKPPHAAPRVPAGPPASPWARKHEPPPAPGEKPRRSHAAFGDAVWFSVDVGRARNADPRWLLPLLCRRGGVVKEQIGKIQILPSETRFQIVEDAAGAFERSAKKPDAKDPSIHIKRVR